MTHSCTGVSKETLCLWSVILSNRANGAVCIRLVSKNHSHSFLCLHVGYTKIALCKYPLCTAAIAKTSVSPHSQPTASADNDS